VIGIGTRLVGRYLRWRFEHLSARRLRRHQHRRSRALLRFARRRSAFYSEHLSSDRLADASLMDKATMMREFDRINTVGLHRDELIEFRIRQERAGKTELYQGHYSIGLSSGTSGNKVVTVLSPWERVRYAALLWARSGVPASVRHPRVLFALRTNNPAFTAVTMAGIDLVYVDYFVPVDDLIALINDRRLNVLAGPPSVLVLLAERSADITSGIEAVISYAEVLEEPTRDRIRAAFDAPVVQIYQGAEGMLGVTCRTGNLHLNEDVVLVELFDAGDAIGATRRVVVTDLYRRAQPFIRYQMGDLLEIDDEPCDCGSVFRRIRRIHGRSDSVLTLLGRRGGEVRLMPDYVRRSINQASPDIIEYQVVQWAPDDLEVRLVLDDGADRASVEAVIRDNLAHWAERADGLLGTVRFTDTPPTPNEGSHKLVRVVNRCQ
jgi:putative adenylate-forming enzyme